MPIEAILLRLFVKLPLTFIGKDDDALILLLTYYTLARHVLSPSIVVVSVASYKCLPVPMTNSLFTVVIPLPVSYIYLPSPVANDTLLASKYVLLITSLPIYAA